MDEERERDQYPPNLRSPPLKLFTMVVSIDIE